jgi:hypothetical protein
MLRIDYMEKQRINTIDIRQSKGLEVLCGSYPPVGKMPISVSKADNDRIAASLFQPSTTRHLLVRAGLARVTLSKQQTLHRV